MLKSILRVFHTWDGTTDPLPERVSPGTKKRKKKTVALTLPDSILSYRRKRLCSAQQYPYSECKHIPKRFVAWLRPVQRSPSLIPGGSLK
jgi:hypothetical protein